MDSFITAFHIDWKIIIAQAINFFIVFIVLYFLALKPLKKLMNERTLRIEGGLNDAKANKELLRKSEVQYAEILAKARTEAHALFQEGKRDAENKREELIKKAEEEVSSMILNGKKSLEAEKAKIIEEAKTEIVSLVVAATEKVLKDQSDSKVTEKAIRKVANI